MAFNNPIVDGRDQLVRSAVKSPNYVTTLSGWSINKDGSAEFSDLTIYFPIPGQGAIVIENGELIVYNDDNDPLIRLGIDPAVPHDARLLIQSTLVNSPTIKIYVTTGNQPIMEFKPGELSGYTAWAPGSIIGADDGIDQPYLQIKSPSKTNLTATAYLQLYGAGVVSTESIANLAAHSIALNADVSIFATAPKLELIDGYFHTDRSSGNDSSTASRSSASGDTTERYRRDISGKTWYGNGTDTYDVVTHRTKIGLLEAITGDINTSRFVKKTSDESVTSSTTVQNDNQLVLAVQANSVYIIEGFFIYSGDGGDIKLHFDVPSGATLDWVTNAPIGTTDITLSVAYQTAGSSPNGNDRADTTLKSVILPKGTLITGATAGNIQLQWAQNVSDPDATTIFANSWLRAQRVD